MLGNPKSARMRVLSCLGNFRVNTLALLLYAKLTNRKQAQCSKSVSLCQATTWTRKCRDTLGQQQCNVSCAPRILDA
eukprot:6212628-Amphidinium_carterae.1